ncbi:MAG TPA: hypothetical protein VIM12_05705 [Noviherbaspirillum sp.]|jgi:hypothetical protein|uniref:hypothetical protein n=1 Tax=Noviherbaspirillum sp. TaxID=1926288 RepID=UPI002F933E17
MKERPILFSAPMVRAILDGTKTQTRRVVKLPHQNPLGQWEPTTVGGPTMTTSAGQTIPEQDAIFHTRTGDTLMCPDGGPGDRLWVRENGWERPERTARMLRDGADTWPPYEYDVEPVTCCTRGDLRQWGWKRRPSIHMPRWASRITLEIAGIRIERLNDCSETDAIAEGIEGCDVVINGRSQGKTWLDYSLKCDDPCEWFSSPIVSYRTLWEQINGAGSWDLNPWVWVVEFKRVDALKKAA